MNILISSWAHQVRQAVIGGRSYTGGGALLPWLPPSLLAEDPTTEPVAASIVIQRFIAFTGEAFFLLWSV